jgi:phage FluMu protein Com
MRCQACGNWNKVLVNKVFIEQFSPEPKVKILIPMYEPLKVSKCAKCGKVIAEPKELIRIIKKQQF